MSKNAYLQECQWCGKQYRLATKLKYCSEECRGAAVVLKKELGLDSIEEALKYHRKGLTIKLPTDNANDRPKRNPFLRNNENKILFPVRYTSGAIRWEWIEPQHIESGVRII